MRAYFRGHAFSPHRHDTYAVGVTSAGVQAFDYRGSARYSLPGQVFVLHPDERHDGRSGDGRGFGYHIAYIDPALVRVAAAAKTLPFVPEPVSKDARLLRAIRAVVGRQTEPVDELMTTCDLVALADALMVAARQSASAATSVDTKAVERARDQLVSEPQARISIAELERASGLSRWQLARQFRQAFGVSPYRFHVLRRLDRARERLSEGAGLAELAHSCGFADQAHFSRRFRSAYGLSPGAWRTLAGP